MNVRKRHIHLSLPEIMQFECIIASQRDGIWRIIEKNTAGLGLADRYEFNAPHVYDIEIVDRIGKTISQHQAKVPVIMHFKSIISGVLVGLLGIYPEKLELCANSLLKNEFTRFENISYTESLLQYQSKSRTARSDSLIIHYELVLNLQHFRFCYTPVITNAIYNISILDRIVPQFLQSHIPILNCEKLMNSLFTKLSDTYTPGGCDFLQFRFEIKRNGNTNPTDCWCGFHCALPFFYALILFYSENLNATVRCCKYEVNFLWQNNCQSPKIRNKRSHNTEIAIPQAFINSRSELVKGSHKRPYVTVSNSLSGGYLEKSKSKARRQSAGQCVNGALVGEQVSNLPVRVQ